MSALGLKQPGNTDGATLNACYLNTWVSGLGSCMSITLLRDDLVWECSGSDHALVAFRSNSIPIVAATARLVPFLLDPAATLGRHPPLRMKLQCLDLVVPALHVICGLHPPARVRVDVSFCEPLPRKAFLFGHASAHGCSACSPVLFSPRRNCLRLLLLGKSPPPSTWALWPMAS